MKSHKKYVQRFTNKKREKLKGVHIRGEERNEQFERKMNQDVDENRMMFRKEVSKRVCKGECLGHNPGDEPLTLTRCYSFGFSQLYKSIRNRGSFVA